MDNLTHSLAGWALGQTGLKNRSRKGLAALILGANMPDIDVFFGWAPWASLATHRGFTHGLLGGVLFLPPVLAGLLWLLDRWQAGRGAVFKSGLEMRFGWLVALSYLGALTHPLLDWQNTYAVQMFAPLSNRWYHNDGLFIIDLWLWIGVAFAIWLSRRRERGGVRGWGGVAGIAVALAIAYISFGAGLSVLAKRALRDSGARPDVVFAQLVPVRFWVRELVWRENGVIGYADWTPWGGLAPDPERVPDNMNLPVVRAAMTATPAIVSFMRWSVIPFATLTPEHCAVRVTFGDARFGRGMTRGRFERAAVMPAPGPGC